ncbi:MAG: class II glutamine amidotransferase [Beijerinckiaceae bacterium]|nr:class II glutamine amidotransferase [Beijerinckiaceae bacterium]
MCRFLAYLGEAVFLDEVITKPCHSLIHQSLHATEAKTVTNGDGFGLGWYGERPTPGVYRELRPAWSDENLLAICSQVRSHAFFAHIRAATGTATSRANCHPFTHQRHMFMHNGQVGCYGKLKRQLENMIPDALYASRDGTTDSEALFLIALANGADRDPVAAFAATLRTVKTMMQSHGVCEPLRFAATFTNGEDLYAFRWSCDNKAPTLYMRESAASLMVASEPTDAEHDAWTLIPQGTAMVARKGQRPEMQRFEIVEKMAA